MNFLSSHIEKIISTYTEDQYHDDMRKALVLYTEKTGQMNEESEEYESRMNSFNDWYIFNYRKADGSKMVDQYVIDHNVEDDIAKSLHNINYSLFLFQKINYRKQIVIKDILHNKKIILAKDNDTIALVEDDMFIGRIINVDNSYYLLNGICILPRNVYSILKKQSKKVRKLNSDQAEEEFLLELENLKTKSLQYGHVETEKIFSFN